MNRMLSGLAGLALVVSAAIVSRTAADPGSEYRVTPQAGGWLICVRSFIGPDAGQLATDFVAEIRRNYHLPAYLVEHGAEERRKQDEEIQRQRELCPGGRIRRVHIDEEFAVLVGGYKDMEAARKALDSMRKLPMPPEQFCVKGERHEPRKDEHGEERIWVEQIQYNPFASGFVVHNPTVPMEQEPEKPDPRLRQLNRDEEFSLLKCGKSWTLAVKTFQGVATIQSQSSTDEFLSMFGMGSSTVDRLSAAMLQAHEVAKLLRSMKFEAYVLHTRNYSVVCVGAYNSKDDPQLLQNQRALAGMQLTDGNKDPNRRVVYDTLFAQPLPMAVPKL